LTTQSLIKWVQGALSEGVVRPGREEGHSSPSSSEITNSYKYTSTLPCDFMAWYLIKNSDNYTLREKQLRGKERIADGVLIIRAVLQSDVT
jgi:hypothetical protein